MKPADFLQNLDEPQVVAAIAAAEGRTSGEIRVFVSEREVSPADVLPRAAARFQKLGMTATRERNAVLLYFVPRTRQFAIIGDRGIHEKCGQPFWDEVTAEMRELLKREQFTEAVIGAVRKVGDVLARHFPHHPYDRDELPNEVIRE